MSVNEYFTCYMEIPNESDHFWNKIMDVVFHKDYIIDWNSGIEKQESLDTFDHYNGQHNEEELINWFKNNMDSSTFNFIIMDVNDKNWIFGITICPKGRGCSICPIDFSYINITFHPRAVAPSIYYNTMVKLIRSILHNFDSFYGLLYRNEIPEEYVRKYIFKKQARMPFDLIYYNREYPSPITETMIEKLKKDGFQYEEINNGLLIYHSVYHYWTLKTHNRAFSNFLKALVPSQDEQNYWYSHAK